MTIGIQAEQALATNFEQLESGAFEHLTKTGRLGIISFHSLEDRMVKRFIRANGYIQEGKKPIFGNDELRFERSAVLRVFHI